VSGDELRLLLAAADGNDNPTYIDTITIAEELERIRAREVV
jgi:hypothetical protein